MATWPSGSKASTANLDQGSDSPSTARADLKQAVDNQNDIIDMFNIASPESGEILVYNNSNTRFELSSDYATSAQGGLADTALQDVIDDTTPQLGGDLDVNDNEITTGVTNGTITIRADGTGVIEAISDGLYISGIITTIGAADLVLDTNDGTDTGSITIETGVNGDITLAPNGSGKVILSSLSFPNTDGSSGDFLTTNGTGTLSFAAITQATGNELENVVEDTTPQLGGDLDVNDNEINTSVENGSIVIRADGTGTIEAISDGLYISGIITTIGAADLVLDTNDSTDSGSITINAGADGDIELAPDGTGAVIISGLTYPNTDGTSGQVLSTDGAGNLTFTTAAGGGGDLVDDTTPQLGGDLDVNGNDIVSVSDGNIVITPDGTGKTVIKNINYYESPVYDLGTGSGTKTPDVANGNVQKITLNGNLTLNALSSPVAGQSLTLIITQDGTGGRTLSSTMKFAGGIKALSGTANAIDIVTVFYDGTTYYASLAKGFA